MNKTRRCQLAAILDSVFFASLGCPVLTGLTSVIAVMVLLAALSCAQAQDPSEGRRIPSSSGFDVAEIPWGREVQEFDPGLRIQPGREDNEKYFKAMFDFLEKHPTSVLADDCVYFIGCAYLRLGQSDKAIEWLEKVVTSYPQAPFEWSYLIFELPERASRWQRADFEFGEVDHFQIQPNELARDVATIALAECYRRMGEHQKAIDCLQPLVDRFPIGNAERETADIRESEKHIYHRSFSDAFPREELGWWRRPYREALLRLGYEYECLKDWEKAAANYESLIGLYSKVDYFFYVYERLSEVYLKMERPQDAIGALKREREAVTYWGEKLISLKQIHGTELDAAKVAEYIASDRRSMEWCQKQIDKRIEEISKEDEGGGK